MTNPTQYSPLALAFLGDAVFDLLVRESLLMQANRPAGDLHNLATAQVNARAQAALAQRLLPQLSEEEAGVFRRGKNAKPGTLPQSCSPQEYALATGLEALFGWLWLRGEQERAQELCSFGDT
ncbi:MAG: ribonuclease III [Oscillospiraceae bacterium]|nr:ribonuclease III [Oscillospiraceae bacterium]